MRMMVGPAAFMPESYTEGDEDVTEAPDSPGPFGRHGRPAEDAGDGNSSGRDGLKGAHDTLPDGKPGRRVHSPAAPADVSSIVGQLTGRIIR